MEVEVRLLELDSIAHKFILYMLVHSGDSESEDPSQDDNHESGNEDDSETAKRLEALKRLSSCL